MSSLNIPQHIIQSIGWTLIHSLWQGLLIFFLLKIAVKVFRTADVRYGLGVGALVLMLVSACATFFVLNGTTVSNQSFQFVLTSVTETSAQSVSFFTAALSWIDTNIIWLLRFWILGFAVGMLRIAAGLVYINRLRKQSHPVSDEWAQMVNNLSESLSIKRAVAMAEAGISSPMVVGFVKPMILFPFGLLSGLTPEQVETILVHELSHIRRQDYIINLFQAVVETIFFFNPFVILISSFIREERENCCDDMVIEKGISPISYVRTLAQLEASRSGATLALGIAGSKNQLLNRIKRIMENSAKNDWGKGRLVPVALLFLGLICASWLSIGSEAESKVSLNNGQSTVVADTTKDGLRVIKRGRKTYLDHPAPPVEQGVPEIEFVPDLDESFGETFDYPHSGMDMPMPDMPIAGIPMPDLDAITEALEAIESMPPMPDFNFAMPAIPADPLDYAIHWRNDSIPDFEFHGSPEEWANFEKDFTEKFKEQFKDFYEKNQEQMEKMMSEMRKEREREAAAVVDLDQLRNMQRDAFQWKQLDNSMWQLQNGPNKIYVPGAVEAVPGLSETLGKMESIAAMQFDKQFHYNNEPLRIMSDKISEQKDFLQEVARNAEDYKEELVKMLREDGYIGKNENLSQYNINDDGIALTINGKDIKEKDRLKYRALHDKYFSPRYKREGRRSE